MATRRPYVEPADSCRAMVEPHIGIMPRLATYTDEAARDNPRDAYEAYLMACRILTAMRRDLSRRR